MKSNYSADNPDPNRLCKRSFREANLDWQKFSAKMWLNMPATITVAVVAHIILLLATLDNEMHLAMLSSVRSLVVTRNWWLVY
jgi:hypothetical protein